MEIYLIIRAGDGSPVGVASSPKALKKALAKHLRENVLNKDISLKLLGQDMFLLECFGHQYVARRVPVTTI